MNYQEDLDAPLRDFEFPCTDVQDKKNRFGGCPFVYCIYYISGPGVKFVHCGNGVDESSVTFDLRFEYKHGDETRRRSSVEKVTDPRRGFRCIKCDDEQFRRTMEMKDVFSVFDHVFEGENSMVALMRRENKRLRDENRRLSDEVGDLSEEIFNLKLQAEVLRNEVRDLKLANVIVINDEE